MKINKPLARLACLMTLLFGVKVSAEEMAVVNDDRVNVRGQPSLVGEVITQLQKGEKVMILEEITAANPKTNEPAKWARIEMPANTPVWVFASYVDPASKTVRARRLNLRAGPGENYSVVGRLERGAPVSEIRRVEDWMEIETPPGAYAFVAAEYLSKGAAAAELARAAQAQPTPPGRTATPATSTPAAAPDATPPATQVTPPEPAPQIAQAPAIQEQPAPSARQETPPPPVDNVTTTPPTPAPSEPTSPPPQIAETPQPAARTEAVPPSAPAESADTPARETEPGESRQRRIVRREGIVRSTFSIQAPTYYELLNPDNRKTINFLHTEKLGLNLKDYKGRRIIVTGEEAVDPRWPKTPVIEVDTLELIP